MPKHSTRKPVEKSQTSSKDQDTTISVDIGSFLKELSQPTEDTESEKTNGLFITEASLRSLVQHACEKAIQSALQSVKKEVGEIISRNLEQLTSQIFKLETTNEMLAEKIMAADKCSIDSLAHITSLEREVAYLRNQSNDLEQYSRKQCIRVFGLPEHNGENCRQDLLELFSSQLGVNLALEEIDVAHRVGRPIAGKPRAIIARLVHRSMKDQILANRRRLKGKKIGIAEDLTSANVKLLNRAKNHPEVEDAWFVNGKIIAKFRNGKKQRLNIGCSIESLAAQ